MSEPQAALRPPMVDEEKDVIGWEQTKEAPIGDEPNAEQPMTRIENAKPKLGSDERARLADDKRT